MEQCVYEGMYVGGCICVHGVFVYEYVWMVTTCMHMQEVCVWVSVCRGNSLMGWMLCVHECVYMRMCTGTVFVHG